MKLITYARMGKVGFGVIKNGGIIEVSYFSSEDFERIIDLLNSVS